MLVSFGLIIRYFFTIIIALILTPIFKIISVQTGLVDKPNARRINKVPMPTAGGLSIFVTFTISVLGLFHYVIPADYILPILWGGLVIVITGVLDDRFELSPKQKSLGILLAALIIYFFVPEARMESLTIPLIGQIHLGWLHFPFTLLWIYALTNAVNLIDGLDGLAAGVSLIGLITIGIIGYFFLHESTIYVSLVIFCLVACIIGFLPYNFYPAKIYLGDTGALFLGFMIAVLSLQGLKNATFISLVTPFIILAVPVTDTFFAIIRRKASGKSISSADKRHLHHQLMSIGFSHPGAVLTIYAIALIFSATALLVNYTGTIGTLVLVAMSFLALELLMELIGVIDKKHRIITNLFRFFGDSDYRRKVRQKYFKK